MPFQMLRSSAARTVIVLSLVAGVTGGGCGTSPREAVVVEAVHRFVDPVLLAKTETNLPAHTQPFTLRALQAGTKPSFHVASVGNDSRFALAVPAYDLVSIHKEIQVPANGVVKLRRTVPRALYGANEIVVLPTLKVDSTSTQLPPVLSKVERTGRFEQIDVLLDIPAGARGRTVDLQLYGFSLTWPERTRFRTPSVMVPDQARFEAAVAVRNPAAIASSTTFTLSICDGDECAPVHEESLESSRETGDIAWKTVVLPLGRYAGREVSFEFTARTTGKDGIGQVFPLWGNPTIYAPRRGAAPGVATNVVLISLDTLGARHMSVYGYPRETTPKMKKRFGEQGVIFDRCVAAATATAPSHMTMMTGLFPLEHNVTDGLRVVDPNLPLVADLVRAKGIETAAFTEDGWLSVQLGFGSGFNSFSEDRSPDIAAPIGRVERTFGLAGDWIAANRDKPFFLFLHTFEVHDPYAPPVSHEVHFRESSVAQDSTVPEAVSRDRLAYDREVRYVDDQLDALLAAIDAAGAGETTLVIVVSDHGEAFGEHGWLLHSNYPYEEVLHVPLMMRGAGVRAGRRIERPVGHVDIAPTILAMLGVPPPVFPLRGVSLEGILAKGEDTVSTDDRVMYAESWGSSALNTNRATVPFLPPALVARRGDLKLVRYRTAEGSRYEGYDLAADPRETRDASSERPGEFAELRKLLDAYEAEAKRAKEVRMQGAAFDPGDVNLAPDQEEKLRALGYLQ